MNDSKHNRLLKEILEGEEMSNFREASLEHGLASIRRQRRRRRVLRISAMAMLPFLLALSLVLIQPAPSSDPVNISLQPSLEGSSPPSTHSRLKIISDEELLALFPDRPLALIGRPGEQQFVLLGE